MTSAGSTHRAGKRVLVVEDDPDILLTVKELLELEGYAVDCAENGAVALERIREHGTPHLILLDMKMPVMNGWQFAAELHGRYDALSPVVVMTAAGDAARRAKDVGAAGWVGKPFDLDDLLAKVRAHENA
jgi:CheY-like chemotaxis protein